METAHGIDQDACALEMALGGHASCPGAACPMWDEQQHACALHEIRAELRARPAMAQHLLAVRIRLESVAPRADSENERIRFFHRLNLAHLTDGDAS